MANEPERPIEKLLRAAAKKRGDEAGAPFELHPADRRLWQGEVARQFARPQREAGSLGEIVARLWPRFAWAVGILAVLGVSVWVLLPLPRGGKPEGMLAQNRAAFEAAPAKEPVPQATPAPATIAPPVASEVKLKPAEVAYLDTAERSRATPARQLRLDPQPLGVDSPAALAKSQDEAKFALAAGPQLADLQKAAEMQRGASGETPAQAPVGRANDALGVRYGLAAKPGSAAGVPAIPAAAPAVTRRPEAASVAALDGSAMRPADEAAQASPSYKSAAKVASADRPSSAPVATDGLYQAAPAALKETKGVAVAQRFVQVGPGSQMKATLGDKATPAHPVLASFQVEQAGEKLRIVDGDGSVYSGFVQIATAARRARPAKAEAPVAAQAARAPAGVFEEKAAPGLDSGQLAAQTYSFHVTGTNRSLNKKVVFTGNLLAATNLALSLQVRTDAGVAGRLGGSRIAPAQSVLLPLVNSRISGKVVVGGGKAVEINALPAGP